MLNIESINNQFYFMVQILGISIKFVILNKVTMADSQVLACIEAHLRELFVIIQGVKQGNVLATLFNAALLL